MIIAGYPYMAMESVAIGKCGEARAVEYLIEHGYKVLEKNYRSQQGEIDIIARDNGFLVFVEVKNYSFNSLNMPLASVGRAKRESMIHAARTYLLKNNIKNINCRFDVLAIYCGLTGLTSIELIKDAFHVS